MKDEAIDLLDRVDVIKPVGQAKEQGGKKMNVDFSVKGKISWGASKSLLSVGFLTSRLRKKIIPVEWKSTNAFIVGLFSDSDGKLGKLSFLHYRLFSVEAAQHSRGEKYKSMVVKQSLTLSQMTA